MMVPAVVLTAVESVERGDDQYRSERRQDQHSGELSHLDSLYDSQSHPSPPPSARLSALALRYPLRAKIVKAKSIVAREPASCRVRPRLGHESHGLPLAAEVDNGEARDHLNVRGEPRPSERLLDANRCLNRVASPIEKAHLDRETRSAARPTPDVNQGKDGATAQTLDSEGELLGRAATQRSGLGVDRPCQRQRPARLFPGCSLLHQRCHRPGCCRSGGAKRINRCGDKQGDQAAYDDPGQAPADHFRGCECQHRRGSARRAFPQGFPLRSGAYKFPVANSMSSAIPNAAASAILKKISATKNRTTEPPPPG